MQESQHKHSSLRQIGKGFCGSAWASDHGRPLQAALKREDGGPFRSVRKEWEAHVDILSSLAASRSLGLPIAIFINIPQHRAYIDASDHDWWRLQESRFPAQYEHCNTLISERTPPLDREARETIIDKYCPSPLQSAVRSNRKDEDCLVRVYLGRRRKNVERPSRFFTLRNKPLYVDQLVELGLPIESYAREMADALAIIYWHAHKDANDIEFVIAPPRQGEAAIHSDMLGSHRLWVLDFDCVNPITFDDQGIDRAARAFLRNDPYYPRPDSNDPMDQDLWRLFADRFIHASTLILGEENVSIAWRLLRRIEELGEDRRARVTDILGQSKAD